MSLIKRLSATIMSRVEDSVARIENHDAVIQAAISDTRREVARAKVRANRLQADGAKLSQQLNDLRIAESQWVNRARDQAETDRETALACLRRRHACQAKISSLEQLIARQKEVEQRVLTNVDKLESRLQNITQQRDLMRSRQSAATVNRCLQEIEGTAHINIDDTFERWEMQVTEAELTTDAFDNHECRFTPSNPDDPKNIGNPDQLEKHFLDQEEKAALDQELQSLIDQKEQ